MTDTAIRRGEPRSEPADRDGGSPTRNRAVATAAWNALAVLAFVLAAWSSDPVRELAALAAGRLPAMLYALAAAALGACWLLRLPGVAGRLGALRGSGVAALVGRSGPASGVIAYLIPLFGGWETARSPYMVGGVVPWSDATLYFGGAQRILFFDGVDDYGAGRPIHPAFLAVRLALTGLDLRKALVIGSVLLGLACFLAARAVGRDLGWAAGVALFAAIYGFASPAGSSVMTEGLGVTFGALGLASLWTGARHENRLLAMAGLALLTVAQGVRTGAILVLPAVVLWLAYRNRGRRRWLNPRLLVASALAVLLGVTVNVGALVATRGALASLRGHSGFVLYGLATGHPSWNPGKPNWTQVFDDHPGVPLMGAEGNKFVSDAALRAVRERPVTFVKAVVRSALNYAGVSHRTALAPVPPFAARGVTVLALLAAGAFLLARRREGLVALATDVALMGVTIASFVPLRDPWRVAMFPAALFPVLTAMAFVAFIVVGTRRIATSAPLGLAVVGLVGCAASAPLLGADADSARNFAATVPMMALPLALAVAVLARLPVRGAGADDPLAATTSAPPRRPDRAPALVGAGMLAATLVGTPLAAAAVDPPPVSEHRCPDGRTAHAFFGGVALRVVPDGRRTENRRNELESSVLERLAPFGWRLGPATVPGTDARQASGEGAGPPGPRTMLSVVSANGDDRVAYVEGAVDEPRTSVLYLCGQDETDGISVVFSRVFWPKPITFAFFTGSPLPD